MNHKRKIPNIKILLLFIIAFTLINLFLYLNYKADTTLSIVFIDVGQGDATLITTPNKKKILIDGGAQKEQNLVDAIQKGAFFAPCEIEVIIATHPHADHIKGLIKAMDICEVETVFFNNIYYDSALYLQFLQKSLESAQNISELRSGSKIIIEDVQLATLWPPGNSNNHTTLLNPQFRCTVKTACGVGCNKEIYETLTLIFETAPTECQNANMPSIVNELIYKNFNVLLTADAEKEIIEDLKDTFSQTDILKIPHHGSDFSFDESIVTLTNPQIGVISVGRNRYGHPSDRVLGTFSRRGMPVLRTDQSGSITVKSDGGRFWVE